MTLKILKSKNLSNTHPLLPEFAGSPNPGFLDYNLYLPQGWPVFKPGQEEDSCCFCFLLPQCCQSSPKSKLFKSVWIFVVAIFGCTLHMFVHFNFEDQNKVLFVLWAPIYANLKENSRRRQQIYSKYIKNIFKIYSKYIQNIFKIYSKYIQNIFKIHTNIQWQGR